MSELPHTDDLIEAKPAEPESAGWSFSPPDPVEKTDNAPVRLAVLPASMMKKPSKLSLFRPKPKATGDELVLTAPTIRDSIPERDDFLDDIFEEEAPRTKVKKPFITFVRRPRAYTGFLAGILYTIIVITASCVLGTVGWKYASDVLALQKKPYAEEVFLNYSSDMSIDDLSALFYDAGLVDYKWLFRLYCSFSHAETKMSFGEYIIQPGPALDYRALVHTINRNSVSRAEVSIVFREGLTQKQMFDLLVEKKVCSLADLREISAIGDFRYSFLNDLPSLPNRLEGFLFPDTYTFYVNESPTSTLRKLLVNFDSKVTAEMRKQIEKSGYTMREVITIASLIELESGGEVGERENVSSVIYNRLKSNAFPNLQIDASLLYFMDGRREITAADLAFDSPYNTYLYPGLPPTPICNPSLESIRAAIYPNTTKYYYYLLNDDDVTVFCKSAEEFAREKAKYDRYK